MFDLAAAFAPDYAQAREKFQAAAAARSLPLERHVHPTARATQGETLSMDVAVLGDADAGGEWCRRRVLPCRQPVRLLAPEARE